jgi:hypothetical protein
MEACAWPASDLRFDFAARAPPDAEDDLADPDAIYARFSVSLARVSPGSFLQLVDHIKKNCYLVCSRPRTSSFTGSCSRKILYY